MEIAQILILIHASFGGLALSAGLISLISRKGSKTHRITGNVFHYSMLFVAVTAFIIAVLPQHESVFLIIIGIFSSYFVITGKRALKFKTSTENLKLDIFISWTMLVIGVIMIMYPFLLMGKINIILFVFGGISLLLSRRDLYLYRNPEKLKQDWLKLHLSKMIGGYISASTAFVVVNQLIPSFYGWFVPGLIGGGLIFYWIRKVKKK